MGNRNPGQEGKEVQVPECSLYVLPPVSSGVVGGYWNFMLFAHPLASVIALPTHTPFSRGYIHVCLRLGPLLASLRLHISSGGSLEPIKIYKPQVVSEIPRINLLSGVLICVVS